MSQVIDARGRSCPEPVILARQGLTQVRQGELTVLVDTPVAKENVTRFLQTAAKRQPEVKVIDDGSWSITIKI